MYQYETEKPRIFTEDGQAMFLAIRDKAFALLASAGAATMGKIIAADVGGSVWTMMACVDRLVELKELEEIDYGSCAGQHRIFVRRGQNRL